MNVCLVWMTTGLPSRTQAEMSLKISASVLSATNSQSVSLPVTAVMPSLISPECAWS